MPRLPALLGFVALTAMVSPAPARGAPTAAGAENLLEYVASRGDLSGGARRRWDNALRQRFGGAALRDGTDHGVTVAKSVISAAIFFEVGAERGSRAAHDAYHDAAHAVPPPIAINFQVLGFQGRRPQASARRMALDFPRNFDRDIAPELVRWWEEALAAGKIPTWERRQVEAALRETRALMREQPSSDTRIWRLREGGARTEAPKTGSSLRHAAGWKQALTTVVSKWLGTPYRMGGTTRRGVDCSGFTRAVYREAFSLEIPRNSSAQYGIGRPVNRARLAPGDLLFFDTLDRGRVTHVGVYLGKGEFAHASSSRGVRRARLEARYYQRAWVGARRLLSPPPS